MSSTFHETKLSVFSPETSQDLLDVLPHKSMHTFIIPWGYKLMTLVKPCFLSVISMGNFLSYHVKHPHIYKVDRHMFSRHSWLPEDIFYWLSPSWSLNKFAMTWKNKQAKKTTSIHTVTAMLHQYVNIVTVSNHLQSPIVMAQRAVSCKTMLSWNLELVFGRQSKPHLEFLYSYIWDLKETCCVCCAFYNLYFNQAWPFGSSLPSFCGLPSYLLSA